MQNLFEKDHLNEDYGIHINSQYYLNLSLRFVSKKKMSYENREEESEF